MNCLSPASFPLQRLAAAAAKLQLLWSENVISVGGAFSVAVVQVMVLFPKCILCSLASLPPVSSAVVMFHLSFVGEPSQLTPFEGAAAMSGVPKNTLRFPSRQITFGGILYHPFLPGLSPSCSIDWFLQPTAIGSQQGKVLLKVLPLVEAQTDAWRGGILFKEESL